MFGRIWRDARRYSVLAVLLVAVAAASLCLSLASARESSAAARAALLPALAALQQTAQSTADLPGEPPSPADAAGIEQTALGYLRAIDAGEWEAAWVLTHPERRGGIEIGQWSLPRIAEQGGQMEQYWRYQLRYSLPTLLMGAELELGRVLTQEMSGWAELTAAVELPATLVLRRLGDGWAVDLEATRQLEARQAIETQLQAFAHEAEGFADWMRAMMTMEEGFGGGMSLTTLLLSPDLSAEFAVTQAAVSGEEATVRVTARALMRIALPLANGDRGWSIAWCQEPVLLGPKGSFDDVVAGKLRDDAAREACASNLKQLGLAMLMYAQDYDERLPIADRWCGATYPYIRNREIHHCPADDAAFSYAFNYKLSRQPLTAVRQPAHAIALYESEIGKGDAFDWPDFPGASVPDPARHPEGNNYGFVDGHVMCAEPGSCGVQEDAYRLAREIPEPVPGGLGMPPPGPEPPCEE
ncbi:MAG: hypothetical protein AB7Y46_04835 [Armatimonadota bacterium]